MTADEIRQEHKSFDRNTALGNATPDARFQSSMLAEIAAQLAELNASIKSGRVKINVVDVLK